MAGDPTAPRSTAACREPGALTPTDFDFSPTLRGETIVLRPLQAGDFTALHAAASDPEIWAQHPDRVRWRPEIFRARFFEPAIAAGGAFAVTDRDGAIIGSSRFYDWEPAKRSVAIGYTFLRRDHWGGATNAEMKRLMLSHAFGWADRVWFHIGAENWRSRRALEKIGGQFSRLADIESDGQAVPYAFYWVDANTQRLGIEASR